MEADKIEDIYTLSPIQQGMLFHINSDPASEMYVEQGVSMLEGEMDEAAFERAWQYVLQRHPALRTGFLWKGLDKPVQVVHKELATPLVRHDWRDLPADERKIRLEACIKSDRALCSDLSRPPLMRLTLIKLADDRRQFIWSGHHLIHDAWSLSIIFKEFLSFYGAICQGVTIGAGAAHPYRDYVAWLKKQDLAEAERFWRHKLKGLKQPIPLPANGNPDTGEIHGRKELSLSGQTTTALNEFLRLRQLTPGAFMHGVLALLLGRHSGKDDLVYGTVVSGRPPSLSGAESIVGVFINSLPFRVKLPPNDSFLHWLKGLQSDLLNMRQYEYSPLGQIHEWGDVARGALLFEAILVIENTFAGIAGARAGNLMISDVQVRGHSNYPLTLRVTPRDELWLEILYDRRRFADAVISGMLYEIEAIIKSAIAAPDTTIRALYQFLKESREGREIAALTRRRASSAEKLRSIRRKAPPPDYQSKSDREGP